MTPDEEKQQRKVEDAHLEAFTHSMQETWFNRHGLTRFVRWITTVFVSFLAATAFVQANNREQCEKSKPFLKSYITFVSKASEARQVAADEAQDGSKEQQVNQEAADLYREQVKLISPGVKTDCNKAYPIIPILDW